MKKLLPLFCGMAIALALTGCGGTTPQPAATADKPTDAAAPAPARKEIAVIPKGLAHQFWLTVKAGADAGGAEFGYDILWQGPAKETEVAKQIAIVQDMISRKVAAIVMAACDAEALVPTIQQALDAKIPVITIDSGVNSDLPLSFVATDNIAGAKAAADALSTLLAATAKSASSPSSPVPPPPSSASKASRKASPPTPASNSSPHSIARVTSPRP